MIPVRRWLLHPWLTVRVQIALGTIFVAAALSKITDPPTFAHAIYNYRLLPGAAVNVAALILPWIEILLGTALILGLWRRSAAAWIGVLLVVFVVALGFNIARDHAVECGCFNVSSTQKSHAELMDEMKWVIVRDFGLLIMVAQILIATRPAEDRREISTS